jgi:hypothetical protein
VTQEVVPSEESRRSALGALREMLSALANLEQLLRSRAVGPKALSPILPDMAAGCRPLLVSLQPVFVTLPGSPLSAGLGELQAQLSERIVDLERTLGELTQRALSASSRLKAESVVSHAVRQLGGALPLLDLLTDIGRDVTSVDWIETLALSRSGDQAPSPGATLAHATLVVRSESAWVRLHPCSALNLAGLVSSLVFSRREPLRLLFDVQNGSASLRIDRTACEGQAVSLLIPPVLDATGPCLTAAASALSLNLAWQGDSVILTW